MISDALLKQTHQAIKTSSYVSKSEVWLLASYDGYQALILDALVSTKYANTRRVIYDMFIDKTRDHLQDLSHDLATYAFSHDFQARDGLLYCAICVYFKPSIYLGSRAEALRDIAVRKDRAEEVLAHFDAEDGGGRLLAMSYAYMDICHRFYQKFSG